MDLLKKPGISLLLVGIVLFFVAQPIVDKIPLLGGVMSPIAYIVGLVAMIGGGYLLVRSTFGTGQN